MSAKTTVRYEKDGDFLHVSLYEPTISAAFAVNIGNVEIYYEEHDKIVGFRIWGASKVMPSKCVENTGGKK
jgi:uncharacterized protein YuzE